MRKAASHKSVDLLFNKEAARRRLEAKIDINKATGCHVWTGALNWSGYGQIGLEGRVWSTHRLAYELANGAIRPIEQCENGNYLVLHRCDNPPCCNPEHLYLGNKARNSRDMADRCRVRVGYWRDGSAERPNRRYGTVFWEIDSEVRLLSEWSKILSVSQSALDSRLFAGWSKDRLSDPIGTGDRYRGDSATYHRISGVEAAMARKIELELSRKNDDGALGLGTGPVV